MTRRFPIRLERRDDSAWQWRAAMVLMSFIIALVITSLVLLVSGHDPLSTCRDAISAAITSHGALSATLVSATPLLFTGLAAAVAFRMKVWNIGGEGQLFIGAICAMGAGIAVGDSGLAVALPATIFAGAIGGGLWAAIPGVLKALWNASEILTSLMLNYVAILLAYYLIFDSTSYWRDVSSPSARLFPQSKQLAASAQWPSVHLFGLILPFGLLVGVAIAVALYVLINRTRTGFRWRVIAESPRAGRYAGMRIGRTFVVVIAVSGAIAGLAGASQIGDFSYALDPVGLQPAAYGYLGIVVAALCKFRPLGTIPAAIFVGGLVNAGFTLQGTEFPAGLVGTIEGIVLFCVLAGDALTSFRIVLGRSTGAHEPTADGAEPSLAVLADVRAEEPERAVSGRDA